MLDCPTGTETILVVDDTDAFREIVARLLAELGYRVLQAADGAEALRMIAREPDVALLLTDVQMPGMTGPQLAARVAEVAPGCRALFMTGYGAHHLDGYPPEIVVEKPFSPQLLARRIRQRLER